MDDDVFKTVNRFLDQLQIQPDTPSRWVTSDIQKDYFAGGRMELVGSVEAATAASRLLEAFRKNS